MWKISYTSILFDDNLHNYIYIYLLYTSSTVFDYLVTVLHCELDDVRNCLLKILSNNYNKISYRQCQCVILERFIAFVAMGTRGICLVLWVLWQKIFESYCPPLYSFKQVAEGKVKVTSTFLRICEFNNNFLLSFFLFWWTSRWFLRIWDILYTVHIYRSLTLCLLKWI